MIDDPAERILARLNSTPEKVATYLNSGEAVADMLALLNEREAARVRYMQARAERLAMESRLARAERERERLRRWVGYR